MTQRLAHDIPIRDGAQRQFPHLYMAQEIIAFP